MRRMLFRVRHRSLYRYAAPVALAPHWLRLSPRPQGGALVLHEQIDVEPRPSRLTTVLDAEGNRVLRAVFEGRTDQLQIVSTFAVRTFAADTLDADETALADAYAAPLRQQLQPWLGHTPVAAPVRELAAALRRPGDSAQAYLLRLNLALHEGIRREMREHGAPRAPEATLRWGVGACRDLAQLFIAACRSQGLAARFVSGYQRGGDRVDGDPVQATRYMHAWPEVYLPLAGWCGFDPTHGLPVQDAHVALAAAAEPAGAAPIEGSFFGSASSSLQAEVSIDVDDAR